MANSDSSDECSALKTGAAGMLIGAALGAAVNGSKGAAQGAAAGAAIGALGCVTMNYKSKKVRTAQQVNNDYMQENSSLPPHPDVVDYSLQAPHQAVRGNNVVVTSSMTLVDGRDEPIRQVEEKLFVVSPDNKRKQIKSKEAQATSEGGEYSNSFAFTPPSGLAQGSYHLESELYVNDKLAKTASTPIVLASNSVGTISIALK
jgi:hypothetical protein